MEEVDFLEKICTSPKSSKFMNRIKRQNELIINKVNFLQGFVILQKSFITIFIVEYNVVFDKCVSYYWFFFSEQSHMCCISRRRFVDFEFRFLRADLKLICDAIASE